MVYAAASLATVLPEIGATFQEEKIQYNYAASSILARQIEHGAPADLFFSANAEWMDHLEKKNRIRSGFRAEKLSNQLVLIVKSDRVEPFGVQDIQSSTTRHIALGDWKHVPAGIYAQQALQKMGIWSKIKSRVLPAIDVRAALTYVEHGEADCGIVYKTDALISSKVKIVAHLPPEVQPDIRYAVAIPKQSTNQQSELLFRHFHSNQAQKLFEKHGFVFLSSLDKH